VSPHHDVSDRATPRRAARLARSRRVGKHRLARPSTIRKVQLFGLTAALAAAAGTTAVSLNQPSSPAITPTASSSQPDAITTARINRRQLGSRDGSRTSLSLESARKRQADVAAQAQARAAKLAAEQTVSLRRALSLKAAKAAADAKAAAVAKQEAAAAQQQAAADAQQQAAAAAETRRRAKVSLAVMLPVNGYQLTARFGQGGGRWSHNHTGLDFAAPIGTPIHSVMAGRVIAAQFAGAYGRQVQVRHADGTVTSYAHMSAFSVSVGQVVPAGGQVGAIGVTGNTTGPHVHFEVRPGGGAPIDPEPWLRTHGLHP
jgi:murein DD-endopeptidase MepM/ murein hydrolase activator NlpD